VDSPALIWPSATRFDILAGYATAFPYIAERLRSVEIPWSCFILPSEPSSCYDTRPHFEAVVDVHISRPRGITLTQSSSDISESRRNPDKCVLTSWRRRYCSRKQRTGACRKKCKLSPVVASATIWRDLSDEKYQGHFFWVSNPGQKYETASYGYITGRPGGHPMWRWHRLPGPASRRPANKQRPQSAPYVHDGTRFWRVVTSTIKQPEVRWKSAKWTLEP